MHRHSQSHRVGSHRPLRPRFPAMVAALAVALAFPLEAPAQDKGDLWEVTMKMEMPGMPTALPPHTNRVCTAKNRKDEDFVPKEENCRLVESNRVGSKLTYKMSCEGKNAMTVAGEIVYGADTYEGHTKISGTMGGRPMDMTQTFTGKRVGDCSAPAK